jgi:amino acid transporter
MFRNTGGVILYATHAFGPFVGFQTGWLAYLGRIASMGANTNLVVTYAGWFWSPLADGLYKNITISLLIVGLTWINVRSIKHSLGIIYIFTILKLLPISLLILFGLGHIDLQMLGGAELPQFSGLSEAVLIVLYAYVGFEGTVVAAGEGQRPRRDLPGALVNTILVTGLIYVLVQMVAVSSLPDLAASTTALTDVAVALFGPWGATLLTLGAVFSISGNLQSMYLSAPRMTYALAREGSLPAILAAVHPRFRTPHVSLWLFCGFCLVLALSGSFIWLAVMSTLARLLTYMICIAALPRLEKLIEPVEGQFRLPGGLLIPLIAMLLCLWLITFASGQAWLTCMAFIGLGTVLYALSPRVRSTG